MNKLVLVLFVIILVVTLAVGGFYLFQTKNFSFSDFLPSSYTPIETATQKATKDCKNTGFSGTKDADSYLVYFIKKIGADKNNDETYLQVINLGNTCWGIWVGDKNGNGTLFWEDNQGKTNQIKTKIQQL